MRTEYKLVSIDYHRNGVSGIGFHVIIFTWKDTDVQPRKLRRMMATVFPEKGAIAVLDIDETHAGNVEFACGNSWRGDHYEPQCREWIKRYDEMPAETWNRDSREKRVELINAR